MPTGVKKGPRVERLGGWRVAYHAVGLPETSPAFDSREEAQDWLDRMLRAIPPARRPRRRSCLCCGAEFLSDGAHNRMCDPCRRRPEPFAQRGGFRFVARF